MNPPTAITDDAAVCVVIPCHNYARYIREAIRSVRDQTWKVIDLIVYDDGSTDGSFEIARGEVLAARDRFRSALVVTDPKNQGKLHSLNVALPMVNAPIVSILDADDRLAPRFLEATIEALREARRTDPRVSFAYTDCELMREDGAFICRGNSEPFDPLLLRTQSYLPDSAPTLTSALREILPFDVSIRVATKHHKWLRLIERGHRGAYVPEALFSYRMHDRNMSSIGRRVMSDLRRGTRRERILSRYWGTSHIGHQPSLATA